jgi:hypothetical protein
MTGSRWKEGWLEYGYAIIVIMEMVERYVYKINKQLLKAIVVLSDAA